mgnify:FL=1|nr:hypothetical protein [Mesorhizobium sp.]
MVFRSFSGRFVAGVMLAGFMLTVAGCQSSDSGGILNLGTQKQDPQAAQPKVTASSLQAYCPKVTVRDGTAYYDSYAKGGQGDQSKIVYQASIADVTRDCSQGNGTLTLNVAIAGKVVPGPLASTGTITMPIRIVVAHGADVLYSQLHQYKLQLSDLSAATQFVFNEPNITVPAPTAKDYQVFAGYDEGPAKPAAAAAKPRPHRKKAPVVKKTVPVANAPAQQAPSSQTSISDIPR